VIVSEWVYKNTNVHNVCTKLRNCVGAVMIELAFTNTSRAWFTGREDWGGYFSTVWFHSFLHSHILVCIRIDLWFDLQFPLLPQHMSPWFKRNYQSRTFNSANLLEFTSGMLTVYIQLVCNARSRWVRACNSTIFPSRPLIDQFIFRLNFPRMRLPRECHDQS